LNFNQDWQYLFTSLEGRINRQPFWAGVVVLIVINVAIAIVTNILGAIWGPLAFLGTIASLIMIYPAVVLYAKRWHDRSKSGWWSLVALIPLLGAIYMIYELGFQEGVPETNQYGPNPLATARA
jgi:uncharacterized membrane protein YhaH (DUF805 family)